MKAAAQCGEDGDAWIKNFSEELRQKQQDQADKENKANAGDTGVPILYE